MCKGGKLIDFYLLAIIPKRSPPVRRDPKPLVGSYADFPRNIDSGAENWELSLGMWGGWGWEEGEGF